MAVNLSDALEVATRSDTGRVRPHNEDSVFVDLELGLALLADGMGGYNAGEVASSMATRLMASGLANAFAQRGADRRVAESRTWVQATLAEEVVRTNATIHEAAANQPQYSGMGTTLVAAIFHDNLVTVAHAGDSRLYRLRDWELGLLTRDHSVLQEQIDDGAITVEQARQSKYKNLLTRALGVDPEVDVAIGDWDARPGDQFLLCSDGLTDMVADDQIAMTMLEFGADPEQCASRLVDLANENGGRDNISVVLLKVKRAFPARHTWWRRMLAWFR